MGEIESLRAVSLLEHSGAFLWVMHLCIFAKTSLGVKKKKTKKASICISCAYSLLKVKE